jgi:hypothetical protein
LKYTKSGEIILKKPGKPEKVGLRKLEKYAKIRLKRANKWR